MLNKHVMMTAIMARANKEIRNRVRLPRKDSCIQETKKSYTREHPVSITQAYSVWVASIAARLSLTAAGSRAAKKWRLPMIHGDRHLSPRFKLLFCVERNER
jgi:hypothetical protein